MEMNQIAYGDRIFARVTMNGRTVFNFMTENVSNMSELIVEIKKAIRDLQGLVILHIRNYHRGWGQNRPLMLRAAA